MEIQKHKKEAMRVVNTILSVAITILVFVNNCNSQSKIIGKWIDTMNGVGGTSNVYFFNEDNTFEQIKYYHLDRTEKFKGRHLINSDTLILEYVGYDIPNLQQYFIKSKPIKPSINDKLYPNALTADIIVVNENNEPFPGVNLMLRNENEYPIIPFITDRQGKISVLYIYDRYVDSFYFSFIGRQDVSIDTQELFGNKSDIKVILYSDSLIHNTSSYKKEYLIVEKENKKIIMLELDNNKRKVLILKRNNKSK